MEMYSTYKNSLLLKDLFEHWKSKIFKHITAVSKDAYFDVLDDIVDKYNGEVHRSIKMKLIDVTTDSYVEYKEHSNKKDPTFKAGDHVRILK